MEKTAKHQTKTLGISLKTAVRDIPNKSKNRENTKICDPKAGIPKQRTQFSQRTDQIVNVLILLKNSGKSDSTNSQTIEIRKIEEPNSSLPFAAAGIVALVAAVVMVIVLIRRKRNSQNQKFDELAEV